MSVERPRPLVAGNWKMNGLKASASVLTEIQEGFVASLRSKVDLAICPPATLIAQMADQAEGSGVAIGGQDCHPRPSGAFTGDLSAEMLADAGATCVLVGHSERRQYHAETDADVSAKAVAAHRAGLVALAAVGEEAEVRSGRERGGR